MSPQQDQDWMDRITQGDSDALSELYDHYHTLVFSLARNILGNHHQAEEVTLEVFTRLWKHAATYNPQKASLQTWMLRITRNLAIDRLRAQESELQKLHWSWEEAQAQSQTVKSPEAEFTSETDKQQVHHALDQLSEDQKEAVLLNFFKGYSHQQIAEVLDVPVGTVKARIRLSMKKLKNWLSPKK